MFSYAICIAAAENKLYMKFPVSNFWILVCVDKYNKTMEIM